MVELTAAEKKEMCLTLTAHLPKIRKLLSLTQADLGNLTGLSRVTISQIESGKVRMTWLHLNAIMFICSVNLRAKEYFYANDLLGIRFLQFVQGKDENIPPDVNVTVRTELIAAFQDVMKNN
ncbi:MAG: helix-turn-helix domain-containing protein [Oscillospiraceae bacterium]|jgi:DNA-binding XRE family transcriptional regulator|nr:helix-turn-helix domain-containing protein [Oscillospiraceae bacterium]